MTQATTTTNTTTNTTPSSYARGTEALSFSKYHGLGNDFILIDNRCSTEPLLSPSASQAACDRHEGIGADGVIFLLPSSSEDGTDFTMRIYNSDGSEPEMCGNGIRCLAQFARDLHIPFNPSSSSTRNSYRVSTLAGIMETSFSSTVQGTVRVNMGCPVTQPPASIPTTLEQGETLVVNEVTYEMHCVSMGNPHAVTFVSDETFTQVDERLEEIGPLFEGHEKFPQKVNTEFVVPNGDACYKMVVWERGAGRTRACGTGACAVAVAAVMTGRANKDEQVVVELPGGKLVIEWLSGTDEVMMTGAAEFVFNGKM